MVSIRVSRIANDAVLSDSHVLCLSAAADLMALSQETSLCRVSGAASQPVSSLLTNLFDQVLPRDVT